VDKAGWKVDNQIETIGLGSDNHPVEGWKVFFHTTPAGVNGSVFVPKALYNAERVRALIQEQVAHINAVHGLSGQG
jgi:hypothetical protein